MKYNNSKTLLEDINDLIINEGIFSYITNPLRRLSIPGAKKMVLKTPHNELISTIDGLKTKLVGLGKSDLAKKIPDTSQLVEKDLVSLIKNLIKEDPATIIPAIKSIASEIEPTTNTYIRPQLKELLDSQIDKWIRTGKITGIGGLATGGAGYGLYSYLKPSDNTTNTIPPTDGTEPQQVQKTGEPDDTSNIASYLLPAILGPVIGLSPIAIYTLYKKHAEENRRKRKKNIFEREEETDE